MMRNAFKIALTITVGLPAFFVFWFVIVKLWHSEPIGFMAFTRDDDVEKLAPAIAAVYAIFVAHVALIVALLK